MAISGDGRVCAASFGDGTIRWYNMKNGAELLTLFPHADQKRWVAWTPSGFYDCSPGAEDLIGWHINRGKDRTPDFYPASRFRVNFYRPDIVAQVLLTGDERLAAQIADRESGRNSQAAVLEQKLPPVVRILSPADSGDFMETALQVKYAVRSP